MKKDENLDLASLSLEELMEGLEAVAPPARSTVDLWAESEGYYPGTTRVPAAELYAKYVKWLGEVDPETRPLAIRVWGKSMADKFKRGHGKHGSHYYISRESLSE